HRIKTFIQIARVSAFQEFGILQKIDNQSHDDTPVGSVVEGEGKKLCYKTHTLPLHSGLLSLFLSLIILHISHPSKLSTGITHPLCSKCPTPNPPPFL